MPENVAGAAEEAGRPVVIVERRNFEENTSRHAGEIAGYLESGLCRTFAEEFRPRYRDLFLGYFNRLQGTPIHPQCNLTLVLPAYREERVIRRTLESLERQTGIALEELEIIVVDNYPEGRKPRLNHYDDAGRKVGEHEDRTSEIARELAAHSKLRVMVVEQAFPPAVAGVGAASKLGMDLAVARQRHNPRVIGYYGADNVFSETWVRGVLDGFSVADVDAVRGVAKWSTPENTVEDEFGLHVLTDAEIARIWVLHRQRCEYNTRLRAIEDAVRNGARETRRQLDGLPTLTAGMYAKIGGMNPERVGEDWGLAQDVADQGHIYWNQNMRTIALGRIDRPRVDGGSYTESLWTMYRACRYGEGGLLDDEGNLLVEDPEKQRTMYRIEGLLRKSCAGGGSEETEAQLLEFFRAEELAQIRELLSRYVAWQKNAGISLRDRRRGHNQGDWEKLRSTLPAELAATIAARWEARFPKIKLAEAEAKLRTL
jgi:hypothetical protein